MTTPHDWEAPGGRPSEEPPQAGSGPQPGSSGHPGSPGDPGQPGDLGPNLPPQPGYQGQLGNLGPPIYPAYPGYPQGPQAWPPPTSVRPPLNGFAVTSLVLGILSGTLLAIIFGVIAVRRINRRGERGRGMAIAGIVLGCVWLVLGALYISTTVGNSPGPTQVRSPGLRSPEPLKVGDCIADLDTGAVRNFHPVSCDQPHRAEVYAILAMGGDGDYPGEDEVKRQALQMCEAHSSTVRKVPDLPVGSTGMYLYPTRIGWAIGDRRVVCLLKLPADRTGRLLPAS